MGSSNTPAPSGYNPYATIDPYSPAAPTPAPQTNDGKPPVAASPATPRPLSPEEAARLAEEDRARLATGAQSLINRRVYDLGRIRNRSADYRAPGSEMLGARKTLLGQ